MACTIDEEVGGVTANSYCTIAEGDTYHETHLYADDWTDAGTDDKCKALQMATRLLDQWFDWVGTVASSTQALLWPRIGAIGPNGYEYDSDELPVILVNATAELARQLIAGDRTADSDVETQGLKSLKAGAVEMTFAGTAAKPIPDSVMSMVSILGTKRSPSGGSVTMRRA